MTASTSLVRASALAAVALAASLGAAAPSRADVHYLFEYRFAGTALGGFEYTTSDFITTETSVLPAALDSCTPVTGSVCDHEDFHVSSVGFASGSVDVADVIGFAVAFPFSTSTSFHYFTNGAFSTPGVYDAMLLPDDDSRLTVSQDRAAPGGGVPEPATWGLMLLGFGGVGAMVRHRTRRATA